MPAALVRTNSTMAARDGVPALLQFLDVTRVHGTGPLAVRALGPVSFNASAGERVESCELSLPFRFEPFDDP